MFNVYLFLGFAVDQLYVDKLAQVNPHLLETFIQKDGEYLSEVQHNEIRFLGKHVGKIVALPQLELLEANIYSLLKKMVPDFPYEEAPLYLFSIIKDDS